MLVYQTPSLDSIVKVNFIEFRKGVKTMKRNQYVVKSGEEWGVRGENNPKLTKRTSTQAEAIAYATKIAKNQKSELRIQDSNGKFHKCNSYGNDTCPPKDKNW